MGTINEEHADSMMLYPHAKKLVNERSTVYSMSHAVAVPHMIESIQTNSKLNFSNILLPNRFPYRIIMTNITVLSLAITIPKTLSGSNELKYSLF